MAESRASINGEEAGFDLVHVEGNHYHLIWKNKSYRLEVVESGAGKADVKVNGQTYQAEIKTETDLLLERLGMAGTRKKEIKELKAPMPGLVLDIKTKAGASVKENEALVVLEAMKMENVLKSPTDGIVKEVLVKVGQALEKNAIILTFE